MNAAAGKTVTINISAANHFNSGRIEFKEGEKVKLAKHLWEKTQLTKNKRMVFRMLKKEYDVSATINKVTHGDCETTITLSKFKF